MRPIALRVNTSELVSAERRKADYDIRVREEKFAVGSWVSSPISVKVGKMATIIHWTIFSCSSHRASELCSTENG